MLYSVYQRRLRIRIEEEESFVGLTISLVRFEKLKSEADQMWLKASQYQSEFWSEMASQHPSLSKLSELSTNLDALITKVQNNFEGQLALCSNSVQVHRRYAQFLMEVCMCVSGVDAGLDVELDCADCTDCTAAACLGCERPVSRCEAIGESRRAGKSDVIQRELRHWLRRLLQADQRFHGSVGGCTCPARTTACITMD